MRCRPTTTRIRSVILNKLHVIAGRHVRPRRGHFAFDGEHRQHPLTPVGVDVLPVQRPSALEAVGENDRHIRDRGPYTATLVACAPLVREVLAELGSRAFGTAAESAIAST